MTEYKEPSTDGVSGECQYQDDAEADDSSGYTFASWSSSYISENDWKQSNTDDILDLEKMANDFEELKKDKSSKVIDAKELAKYIPLAKADFEMIRHTDKYLRETYAFYYEPALDHAPHVKIQTKALIDRLLQQPHFYCPDEREESTELHVSRWLSEYTSNPEKELTGFCTEDPYEPTRFVSHIRPRLSSSETNVVLGKRKRSANIDDVDDGSVYVSSSETMLVRPFARRPRKMRRVK